MELCAGHHKNNNNDNKNEDNEKHLQQQQQQSCTSITTKIISLAFEIQHKILSDGQGLLFLVTKVKHNGQS